MRANPNFQKLPAGYLFPEIGRRVRAFQQAHPEAQLIRLGIGGANLGYSYDNGSSQNSDSESIADGGAAMGAVGYELLSAPRFSIDAQLRMIVGNYDQGQDVSGGSIGVGFNWF